VQRRPRVTSRVLVVVAVVVPAAFVMSGCSPGADYPSIFSAVRDTATTRSDAPMDADQVQQATEALITDRNRLNAGAQSSGAQNSGAQGSGQSTDAANARATRTPPAAAAPAPAGAAAAVQTAGTETK
jgi:outer membrane murein-binding lipoprotein Lpp